MRHLDEAITSSELVAASVHALSQLLAHVRSGQANLLLRIGASTMPLSTTVPCPTVMYFHEQFISMYNNINM